MESPGERKKDCAGHQIEAPRRQPITNEPWGVRRFFVIDPNGTIINVMCHSNENDNEAA